MPKEFLFHVPKRSPNRWRSIVYKYFPVILKCYANSVIQFYFIANNIATPNKIHHANQQDGLVRELSSPYNFYM